MREFLVKNIRKHEKEYDIKPMNLDGFDVDDLQGYYNYLTEKHRCYI